MQVYCKIRKTETYTNICVYPGETFGFFCVIGN